MDSEFIKCYNANIHIHIHTQYTYSVCLCVCFCVCSSLRAKNSDINFRKNCVLFTGTYFKVQAHFIVLLH